MRNKINRKMKLKIFICCILFFFGSSGVAQTKLNFKYDCSNFDETTRVSVALRYSDNKIELLNDTIRKFENILSIPTGKMDYILSVEFENKTIEKEVLDYPFALVGSETDIEVNVGFSRSDWLKKESGSVEVIKYYVPNHNLEIQYLPKEKGDEYYKAPFFMLKNNSNDTIYGQYHPNYFWGSLSFLVDSVWSRDYCGRLDMNFEGSSPLFPDSVSVALVGSFGWRNELLKNRYKYTLLYTTDRKSVGGGVRKHLEKNNFVWWADIKKYYRLIYEFDVE